MQLPWVIFAPVTLMGENLCLAGIFTILLVDFLKTDCRCGKKQTMANNTTIAVPADRQTWESEIATYWWEDGILVSLSKSTKRTVANITSNVALVRQRTGNRPVPLLIYLADSPVPDKETRRFSTEQLPLIYKAMAMVSKPGLAKLIMNILFSLKPPPIPMKSFTTDREAKEWLQQFCD